MDPPKVCRRKRANGLLHVWSCETLEADACGTLYEPWQEVDKVASTKCSGSVC